MKKAITILLIFIMIFTSLPQNRVLALNTEQMEALNEGTHEASGGFWDNANMVVASICGGIAVVIPLALQSLLTLAVQNEDYAYIQLFTIEDLLFGRFQLFDANFMNVPQVTVLNREDYISSTVNVIIKQNVAEWFYALRNFSIVALFAILIYIGIMMAISTIASEKAKYKNMLMHWVASFAILMLLPYIMSIIMNVSEVCVNFIRTMAEGFFDVSANNPTIQQTKGLNFEKTLLYGKADEYGASYDGILTKLFSSFGWSSFSYVLVYCVLVYYQIKFFFMYIKRLLTLGFLTAISPLITITYSIDKASDNKAQAYSKWLTEYLINVFIQPLHALLFIIFMYSTFGIMERAPLLAVIFLSALTRGEKIVRKLFKLDSSTARGLGKGK